jgi:prepilin-type N-terminal cleavage/methylation domain-containing protein
MRRTQGLATFGGRKGTSGFTMIEVLVVIVILAILSSLAIPGFTRWLPNYRLKGAVRDLYSNLQLAKAGAIRDRVDWAIEFPGGNTYRVVARWGTDEVGEYKTVSLAEYGSGVSFGAGGAGASIDGGSLTAIPANPIVFNSRGFTTDEAAVFAYLTNNKNTSFTVGTWASGAVVLRKWNGSDWE